jgi:hypothetical protein
LKKGEFRRGIRDGGIRDGLRKSEFVRYSGNMRQTRFTYPGAYHHCMNRGINGEAIFKTERYKTVILDMAADKVDKFRIWTENLYRDCLAASTIWSV